MKRALAIGEIVLGTIFPFASHAAAQTLTTIHQFTGPPNDGAAPTAGVTIGSGSTLYGATYYGGDPVCSSAGASGCGTAFSLVPPASQGRSWSETVYAFPGRQGGGAYPEGNVTIRVDGLLYGTTFGGGSGSNGTAFSFKPPSSPGESIEERVLYRFAGPPADGASPAANVVIGSGGVLYGTTEFGGTYDNGTVFSLKPPGTAGGAWTETVLYNFAGYPRDGGLPTAGLVIGSGGVLYGATEYGGTYNYGTVFSLTPPASPGGSWTETVVHDFSASSDGAYPEAAVVIGSGGVLYGTTVGQGDFGFGTVFAVTPPASPGGDWSETVLHSFGGARDGASPNAAVTIGSGGVLYGTTDAGGIDYGTVFSLTPPASAGGPWAESVLYAFTGGDDGAYPYGGLTISRDGVLYGTTYGGGTGSCSGGCGTVFAITSSKGEFYDAFATLEDRDFADWHRQELQR